jgi:NADH-quinone oxidoreductase subunit G
MPILDLRIRKAVRLHGAKLVVASARPTALDGGAEEVARFAPGGAAAWAASLPAEIATLLDSAENPLLIHGERAVDGDGASAVLGLAEHAGARLLEVPAAANGRGLREVGCLPGVGPGLADAAAGKAAGEIRAALESGELEALILWEADPVRDLPDSEGWRRALGAANFVVSVSMFGNESGGHADVFLPAEAYAEKEGTVTHPDGRLQRVRPNVPAPGAVRPGWEVLAELAARLGDETGIDSASEALAALADDVSFYAGITPEEIGGLGIRWQNREEASGVAPGGPSTSAPSAEHTPAADREEGEPGAMPGADGRLELGTYRDLWAAEAAERSPALRFLVPSQTLELAPADAQRLGVSQGDEVDVRNNGTSLRARVRVHQRMREGAGFLIDGLAENSANALAGAETVEVKQVAEGGG